LPLAALIAWRHSLLCVSDHDAVQGGREARQSARRAASRATLQGASWYVCLPLLVMMPILMVTCVLTDRLSVVCALIYPVQCAVVVCCGLTIQPQPRRLDASRPSAAMRVCLVLVSFALAHRCQPSPPEAKHPALWRWSS
jgi:hypothetical protein